ncbi:MAG: SUF system Fe-S cluster assembly protein [Ectothiorhodospiraceae bacterium]|nr:SUF system Fe-S cluster assembly protein [Chromatiales bacterium]MCP5156848.1 SUF system Fe-S cluster assembly protein [Ectothiorhodospiraceae bacterium]
MSEQSCTDTADTATSTEHDALRERIIDALRQIYDPEIPVNIYDLGLVYRVDIDVNANVEVDMTLTSPGCPVAQTFPGLVEESVRAVDGVNDAVVELVWDPPWTIDALTDEVKLQLGLL